MSTTLNGAINASVTSLTVASAAGFPTAGTYNILIDSEVLKVTGGQGTTTWTVVRARRGTTGATHANGATVTLYQRTTLRRLMRGQHSPDILAEAIRELQDALDGSYGHVHTGAQDDGPATENTTTYGTGTTSLTPDNAVSHGTTNNPARTDHVHGLAAAVVGTAAFADAAAEGTGSSVARSDHVHGMPVNPTNELLVNGDCEVAVPTLAATSGTNAVTAALDAGQAWLGSKSLKVTTAGGSADAFFYLGAANLNGLIPGDYYTFSAYVYVPSGQGITLSNVFLRAYDYQGSYNTHTSNTPGAADRWEKLTLTLKLRASATQLFFRLYLADATASRYVYYDHVRLSAGTHPAAFGDGGVTTPTPSTQAIGDSAAEGTGFYPARYDHKHALPGFGAVDVPVFGDAAGNGVATTVARSDHAHGWPTTNPFCAIYSSGSVSIPSGAITPVTFNAIRQDATFMHRTSAANLTGTVSKTATSATLTGSGTSFTFECNVGQMISVPGGGGTEVRVITAIASDTSLTVSSAFANTASGQTATRVNTGIVARAAGFYLLDACAEWANGTNGARLIGFRVNGTTEILRASTEQTAASTTPSQAIARGYYLNQWDYVEVVAYQATDGGGLNITAAGNYSPEFTAQWVAG